MVRLKELVHDVIGFISCAAPDLRQQPCSTTSTADSPLMDAKIYKLEVWKQAVIPCESCSQSNQGCQSSIRESPDNTCLGYAGTVRALQVTEGSTPIFLQTVQSKNLWQG